MVGYIHFFFMKAFVLINSEPYIKNKVKKDVSKERRHKVKS